MPASRQITKPAANDFPGNADALSSHDHGIGPRRNRPRHWRGGFCFDDVVGDFIAAGIRYRSRSNEVAFMEQLSSDKDLTGRKKEKGRGWC